MLKSFFLAALLLVAGPLSVAATAAQKAAYEAAAVKLVKASKPKAGTFVLRNVGTGKYLKYIRSGQQIFPSSSGSPLRFKKTGKYIILSPKDSNDKCGSAQWHFGKKGQPSYDWAMALYACVVTHFKRSFQVDAPLTKRHFGDESELDKRWNARDGDVRHAKQYWLMNPGTASNAFNIIAVDHLRDMPTRAVDSCTRIAVNARAPSKYVCLQPYKKGRKSQEWRVYQNGKLVKRDDFLAHLENEERSGNYGRWE